MQVTPINRLGKKSKMLDILFQQFPEFEAWIEPFAGSGSVGINVTAKFKFMNDLDDNIFDCWEVMTSESSKEKLISYIECTPYSDTIFKVLCKQTPKDKIEKVAIFLIGSNWGYLCQPSTLTFGLCDAKSHLTKKIEDCFLQVSKGGMAWSCKPYLQFLQSIALRDGADIQKSFIYCDPPYLNTKNNYKTPKWGIEDLEALVEACVKNGCKFAISEFESPTILEIAKKYGLNVVYLGERRNIKKERIEVLLTNYRNNQIRLL